jgi:hypothetical protein
VLARQILYHLSPVPKSWGSLMGYGEKRDRDLKALVVIVRSLNLI